MASTWAQFEISGAASGSISKLDLIDLIPNFNGLSTIAMVCRGRCWTVLKGIVLHSFLTFTKHGEKIFHSGKHTATSTNFVHITNITSARPTNEGLVKRKGAKQKLKLLASKSAITLLLTSLWHLALNKPELWSNHDSNPQCDRRWEGLILSIYMILWCRRQSSAIVFNIVRYNGIFSVFRLPLWYRPCFKCARNSLAIMSVKRLHSLWTVSGAYLWVCLDAIFRLISELWIGQHLCRPPLNFVSHCHNASNLVSSIPMYQGELYILSARQLSQPQLIRPVCNYVWNRPWLRRDYRWIICRVSNVHTAPMPLADSLLCSLVEQTMIYAMCGECSSSIWWTASLIIIPTGATLALATYEYLVTFNQERTMIWRRKWSMVTWIFMANRYLLMSSTIWDVAPSTAEVSFH